MDISELLSTKERALLLEYLLLHPSLEIVPDRVARSTGVSKSQAHKYVNMLRKAGIVTGRRLKDSPLLQSIRAVFNIRKIGGADVGGILKRRFPKMGGWGIFGSWAAGANSEGSDLDIWMKVDDEQGDLGMSRAKKEISEKIEASVDLIAATPKRLAALREKSPAFYYSLYNGRVMGGGGL